MRTVITKELGIINNQLRSVARHVRLVGDRLSFEIEIKKYSVEPRCLSQCGDCSFASVTIFAPNDCDDVKNMISLRLKCSNGEDVFSDNECTKFEVAL